MKSPSIRVQAIRWQVLAPWWIVLAGVLAYANSLGSPFIFDDSASVHVYPSSAIFTTSTLIPRGLVNASFLINYYLDGYQVAGYRLVNVLIHILTGLFLFGFLRRSLILPRLGGRFTADSTWIALAISVLWLIHPVQTESVTYICQRYESMTGLFYMLAIYGFARSVQSPRHPRAWTNVAIMAAICAMWSKQTAVTLPFVILLYDYLLVATSPGELLRTRWKAHVAFMATLGIQAMLIVNTLRYSTEANLPQMIDMSPLTYLATECGVIVHYLRVAIVPSGLCLDYAWPPVDHLTDTAPQAIMLVALFVLTVIGIVRRQPMAFPVGAFFLLLAPTSSIFPIADTAADRRLYLPLAAILSCLMVSAYAFFLPSARQPTSRIKQRVCVILAVYAIGLLAGSIHRNTVFSSPERMYRDIITKRPANYRQNLALATLLLDQGRWAEAEQELRTLVSRMKETRLSTSNQYKLATSNFDRIYPTVMGQLGRALLSQGRNQEAIDCFNDALALGPNTFATHNLSLALYLQGHHAEAIEQLSTNLQGSHGSAKDYALLGWFQREQQHDAEAVDAFRHAIALDPTLLDTTLSLAWILATTPSERLQSADEAIALAADVCKQTQFSSPHALDVLAAAYARASRFEEAVGAATKALALLKNSTVGSSASENEPASTEFSPAAVQERLNLYRHGSAYQLSTTVVNP